MNSETIRARLDSLAKDLVEEDASVTLEADGVLRLRWRGKLADYIGLPKTGIKALTLVTEEKCGYLIDALEGHEAVESM